MRAADIAKALGATRRSGVWWRCLCPVHGSRTGTSATLALRDGDRGLIAVCHAGCSRTEIMAELCCRGLLPVQVGVHRPRRLSPPRRSPTNVHAEPDNLADRIAVARRHWDAAREAHQSPVAAYLLGRGITIAPPPSLRWASHLRRLDGAYGPAMVGLVEHTEDGVVGIHRTWLGADANGVWRRIDRATLGPIGGGAVRLAPAAEILMVGEGIETCLAAMEATALPAWAALSTSGLIALLLPPAVRHVIILADNDASGAGQRAARRAAQRWVAEDRSVGIAMPPLTGTDMADVLIGRGGLPEAHRAAA